jgi:hypothetical protein
VSEGPITLGEAKEPALPELAASPLHEVAAEICGPVDEWADKDLFGEPVHERMEKRMYAGAKRLEAYKARTALRMLADPMEVAHYCMMEAFGRKDYATAHARAMELLPFFAPKLSGVALGVGAGPGVGGAVTFTWQAPTEE